MSTNVLIAAHNEQEMIGTALNALSPRSNVLVVANACTDDTVAVARGFGVAVVELEQQGKMPAIQEGLRHLGSRALKPVLLLDADSVPAFPIKWLEIMSEVLERPNVAAAAGPIRYTGANHIASPLRTALLYGRHVKNRLSDGPRLPYGINQGIHARTDENLDAVLDLPHFWPGEDRAVVDLLIARGGEFVQCINPLAAVRASDRYHIGLVERLSMPRKEAGALVHNTYLSRAAPGSVPYDGRYLVPA